MGTAKLETWKAKAKVSCQYRANIVPISVPIYIPVPYSRYWHGNVPQRTDAYGTAVRRSP
jgi:hypothetical protein